MKKLGVVLALTLALSALGLSQQSFAAAPLTSSSNSTKDVVGLMIKYRSGVSPLAPNGQVTGQNFAGASLHGIHGIGGGVDAVSFESAMTRADASVLAANLESDSRVESVSLDHQILASAFGRSNFGRQQLALALGAVIKSASSPATVSITDSWSASAPNAPRVKISWTPPKALYGAKLTGFQIWTSVNGDQFTLSQTVSKSTARSIFVSAGLRAGYSARAFVKAVTRAGLAVKIGLPSKTVSVVPTSAPSAPTITGYVDNVISKPKWTALSMSQRGGLPVTYTATATASSSPSVTCNTNVSTCQFSGLVTGVDYAITVTASNSRGSSVSPSVLRPSDDRFNDQWYLFGDYGIDAPAAWAMRTQNPAPNQVVVAVLDTGITSHSDLNAAVAGISGYDFVSLGGNDGDGWDSNPTDSGDFTSDPTSTSSWHGTHVTGLIAAAANGQGIVGVAPGVKIQVVRVLGASGGKQSDLYAAITWASGGVVPNVPVNTTPAKVINISMGTATYTPCDQMVQSAITAALGRGVTIVTSAGNGDEQGNPLDAMESYPGDCHGNITVGATGAGGNASYYSNNGLGVDISAPGGDDQVRDGTTNQAQGMILSDLNTGSRSPSAETFAYDEGTSMASPLVAGAAALLYEKSSSMTPNLVWQYLQAGVKKFAPGTQCALTAGTVNQMCGIGILDVAKTLAAVK
jgi:subtilisin family serine protease